MQLLTHASYFAEIFIPPCANQVHNVHPLSCQIIFMRRSSNVPVTSLHPNDASEQFAQLENAPKMHNCKSDGLILQPLMHTSYLNI